MKEECLICKAPLEYLESDVLMECEICHKRENSKARCVNGHYVCSECHTKGLDSIIGLCIQETSKDPITIIEKMMDMPFCHMHGPEHHVMVGCALLTAYKNAGGEIELSSVLPEMMSRGKKVPGGACGFWGACGAGISAGMFISIITKATPLTTDSWGLSNLMTSIALGEIGKVGGPRCCKRDSFLAILAAIDYVKKHFDVEMEKHKVVCRYSGSNNQCIGARCPFSIKTLSPQAAEQGDVKLVPLAFDDREQFILDNQEAFNYGALEEFGRRDDHFEEDGEIISRETIEESIDGGEAYRIWKDGEKVGGVVIKVEGDRGDLDLLFVSPRIHSRGVGYAAWCAVEKIHPEVTVWETATPYFEKRNIHFYVNRCGFHIVEFFNSHHPDPNDPELAQEFDDQFPDGMFRFEKRMK